MWDPKVHVGTAAVVVSDTDRVLVLRRAPDAAHGANQWGLPGGWVDQGEHIETAVLRELHEETGMLGRYPQLVGVVSNHYPDPIDTVVCVFYQIKYENNEPYNTVIAQLMEPDKAQDMRWYTWQHLKTLDLFPPLRSFIDTGQYLNCH